MKTLFASALVAATALTASAAFATPGWVSDTHLNARSGPGTHYDVLGTFQPCTQIDILEYQYDWAKVSYQNTHYWVAAQYLQDHECSYTAPKPVYKAPKPTYTPPKPAHNNGYSGGSYGTNNY